MNILGVITVAMLVLLTSGCGTARPPHADNIYPNASQALGLGDIHVKEHQVAWVSAGSVNFYTVSLFLYAEQTPQNYFSFSLDRQNVKEGYSTQDLLDVDTHDSSSANWNGRFYSESRWFPTYARLAIKSLTKEEAVIEVSARLVHPETGEFIYLPRTVLSLRGPDLEAFTEKVG